MNAHSAQSGKRNAARFTHNAFSDMTEAEFSTHLGLQPKEPRSRVQNLNFRNDGNHSRRTGGGVRGTRGRGRGLVADATTVDHVKDGYMYPVK
jgi:hypothetical protein|mmetsp:Transcript_47820/g.63210  ORF Transcript_47820/g.63210 Transcript_47820/m.63210 type:complete len:93 (-) Transcript_47820:880-1158(-)